MVPNSGCHCFQNVTLLPPMLIGREASGPRWSIMCFVVMSLSRCLPMITARHLRSKHIDLQELSSILPCKPIPPKFGGCHFTPEIWGVECPKPLVLQCFLGAAPQIQGLKWSLPKFKRYGLTGLLMFFLDLFHQRIFDFLFLVFRFSVFISRYVCCYS